MKTGLSFFFMGTGRDGADRDVYREEIALAKMAEPLGFDSVWATEHHFTDYSMIPSPLQFLAYMAGQTSRIDLGSMVVVLPWHNPARLAGEIGMLDNLADGRFRLGIGRGLGKVEFDGLGADMSTSRQVFDETAAAVLTALETGVIEMSGQYVSVPKRALHPRPTATFVGRTYGAAVSPESVRSMACLGAGLIIIPQKPWETVIGEVAVYREEFAKYHPDREIPAPVVATHVFVDTDAARADELGEHYASLYYHRVMEHYDLAGDHFAEQKGYAYYAKIASRLQLAGKDDAARFYSDLHVKGTPAQCLEKLEWIKNAVGAGTLLSFFSYSGIPVEESKRGVRLYSEQVLPTVKSWA
jgi:alkanesulfonate monooxygenase SsuD/methylene tetrahydromethanopterin reductase-like flavin-dependent oxidoreductase (luciferase family)